MEIEKEKSFNFDGPKNDDIKNENHATDIPPPPPDHTENDQTETTIEESSSHPDLAKLSQDIDQFISALSNPKADEFQPPDVPDFVQQFAILVEAKIANFDSEDSPVRWIQLTEDESSSFLEIVDRISKLSVLMSELLCSDSTYASTINLIGGVLERAMSYLEEEFRSIAEDYHMPDNNQSETEQNQNELSESESTTDINFPGYTEDAVSNLNKLAKALMSGGHETECCQIYFITRRNATEESLHKLGFEKFSVDDVQKMQWEALEREIVTWIKTFKEFASLLFSCEKRLADAVFTEYVSFSDNLFDSLSRGIMIQLLNFAEAVAVTKRSSDKLFKFLDVYEALRDLIPTLDGLLTEKSILEFKSEASLTRGRIGDVMICIFSELENSIRSDTAKTQSPGGAVHPLTRYTMNYLKYACEYKDTLEQVFREHMKIERAYSDTASDYDYTNAAHSDNQNQSPFELQLKKVMDLLDVNLESKSKLYKDTSLSLIFMMNNGRYILQKIKGSPEINNLMGDPWCRKRSSDLRLYHKNYQRETWGRLLHCLSHEGLVVNGKVVKPVLKERFKSFNAMFDEIHKAQITWVVSDEQLQSELRVSISAVVIPAYRSFMGRFSQTFTPGRQTEKYIKYQPEDIETYIDELFDGNATPMAKRR